MPTRAALIVLAGLFAISIPLLLPQKASAQAVSPSTPRDLAKLRTEFQRVQRQMEAVQRDFDRAARTGAPAVRDAALKDWVRALDSLEPYVKELSADNADDRPFIDQYAQWRELYRNAAGVGNAGEFFLQISRYWAELTAGTDGWEAEQTTTSFDAIVKSDANDASANALGLPKTAAFIKAANTYLTNVAARDDYEKFKDAQNVATDRQQVMAALARAQAKFAKAFDGVLAEASGTKLDQASRDKLDMLDEQALSSALDGYPGRPALLARGRGVVYAFDLSSVGEDEASKRSLARLSAAAEREWPRILMQYKTQPMAPVGAGRGQIVTIHTAQNRIGKEFQSGDYDFAGYIDGAPVVGKYAGDLRKQMNEALATTNLKALPDDTKYELVAVVRGTAQVPAVKQRPGATTAPAIADDAAATTSPAVTDCVLLDIVAMKAGPIAVGTPVVATPER